MGIEQSEIRLNLNFLMLTFKTAKYKCYAWTISEDFNL